MLRYMSCVKEEKERKVRDNGLIGGDHLPLTFIQQLCVVEGDHSKALAVLIRYCRVGWPHVKSELYVLIWRITADGSCLSIGRPM